MKEWISVKEKMPVMEINPDGCYCTRRTILFCCAEEKTVHIGYCIKTLVYLSENTMTDLNHWYDQTGYRVENVTHWIEIPKLPEG